MAKKKKATKAAQPQKLKKPAKLAKASKVKSRAKTPKVKLGRPTVTGEEKLYMLFHEDYHARQVFEFLRVETVAELEQFEPDQIFKLLTKPVRDTLLAIRKRLAERNRCLKGDEAFAAEIQRKQDA